MNETSHSYLNKNLLDVTVLKKAQKLFAKSGQVQFSEILHNECLEEIQNILLNVAWKRKNTLGKFNYVTAEVPDICAFVNSHELLKMISKITSHSVKKINCEICGFGWKDYTLLQEQSSGITFMFDFSKWKPEWGGHTCFVKNGKEILRVNPLPNTMTLIKQKGMKNYVKYVNHLAGENKRVVVVGVIT